MGMSLMTCIELGNHPALKSFGFKVAVSKRNSPGKSQQSQLVVRFNQCWERPL